MRIIQVIIFLLLSQMSISQNVGIGTLAPHASARLDVSDTARGLLVPRLTLAQRNAIASPARGLLVFVSTDSSFHYFNGTAWQSLQFADTTGWKRTGNAGTNELNHFIGTSDSVALNFRVKNQKAGRISVSSGDGTTFFGFQAGLNDALNQTANTFIGFQAGMNTTKGIFNTGVGHQSLLNNTLGLYNTANGYKTLRNNTDGDHNTANGYISLIYNTTGQYNTSTGSQSLMKNTTGGFNTASGVQSLFSNTTGFHNTANGFFTLVNSTTGQWNTAVGNYCLRDNTTGNYNTGLGWQANVASGNLTNASAIGAFAEVEADNSLVLGSIAGLNGASSSVKVGIGTTQPQHPLDVKAASAAPLIMLENTTAIGETALRLRSNWPSDGSSNTTITLGLEGSKFNIYADNSISLLTLNPVQAGDFSQGIRMGINNFSPQAPLHVKSSSTSTLARNITFFNSAAATIGANPSWTGTVTGYFEGNVVSTISFIAAANNIFSDERIKDIIGPSNGADDLDKLRRIAITRYRYKDKWQMGNAVQTKVIAQQVKEVLPEAVSQIKNFIPDLLQEAAIVARGNNSITIQLKEGKQLKAGARLKCFDAGGNELLANVLSTKDNTCTLDAVITGDKIFVYGTEVNDFNVVDYDAIAMLNVSATQELLRRLEKAEQTIAQLEALLKKLTKDQ